MKQIILFMLIISLIYFVNCDKLDDIEKKVINIEKIVSKIDYEIETIIEVIVNTNITIDKLSEIINEKIHIITENIDNKFEKINPFMNKVGIFINKINYYFDKGVSNILLDIFKDYENLFKWMFCFSIITTIMLICLLLINSIILCKHVFSKCCYHSREYSAKISDGYYSL